MEVAVYTYQGQDTGRRIDLADAVFALEKPSDHALYMDVRQHQANQRQGTHKSKERSEVHGTNKKPFRQKGTGNARQGDRKSPLFRHGGRIFGPRPRDYSFRLNKKLKQLARRSALTYKAREESIRVMENPATAFNEAPRTKTFLSMLKGFEAVGKKVVLVTGEYSPNVYLSGRNIPKIEVVAASDLNTYHILNSDMLLLTEEAAAQLNQMRLPKKKAEVTD
jgi:large subunit ribosomal protein L4